MTAALVHLGYLVSISCFIVAIKRLTRIRTARSANRIAACGLLLAVLSEMIEGGRIHLAYIGGGLLIGAVIGIYLAYAVKMRAIPQLLAVLNGLGAPPRRWLLLRSFLLPTLQFRCCRR